MDEVINYYRDRVQSFGANAAGVDWKDEESQRLRFQQLARLLPDVSEPVSVLDFGCGYGALFDYLSSERQLSHYCGYDLVPEMLEHGRLRLGEEGLSWCSSLEGQSKCEYAFASGVFNVRLSATDKEWESYILDTLKTLSTQSTKGFAANFLSTYSDPPFRKDYLYYANPLELFDFCKTQISRSVTLLHDYPLYEFSLLVRA